jgi:hypothetical protein
MKITAIKKLVDQYSLLQLKAAEEAMLEEQLPAIAVEGDDEGEQLTHIMAAQFIKQEMEQKGVDYLTALRTYSGRVRNSIS